MGNSYTPPALQKQNTSVEELQPKESLIDTSIGMPTQKSGFVGPADTYKESIDKLTTLLQGKLSGDRQVNTEFQMNFIKNLEPMLSLDDNLVKEILDHFVITIVKNRDTYNYNKVLAPVYVLEGKMSEQDLTRYKRFMDFITIFAENARDRQRFIANFDITKFAAMFGPVARQRLTNYVHR